MTALAPKGDGLLRSHAVQIYYEDTDFSGVVYHANYLRFFERAREHLLGPRDLVDLFETQNIGFVVYKANLVYKAGAKHGDLLDIRTRTTLESDWRATFHQFAVRTDPGPEELLVEGTLELCCVTHADGKLVPIPSAIRAVIGAT